MAGTAGNADREKVKPNTKLGTAQRQGRGDSYSIQENPSS